MVFELFVIEFFGEIVVGNRGCIIGGCLCEFFVDMGIFVMVLRMRWDSCLWFSDWSGLLV